LTFYDITGGFSSFGVRNQGPGTVATASAGIGPNAGVVFFYPINEIKIETPGPLGLYDVTISQQITPEPSSLWLALIGASGVYCMRRRWK
jgi:hypothetical protein